MSEDGEPSAGEVDEHGPGGAAEAADDEVTDDGEAADDEEAVSDGEVAASDQATPDDEETTAGEERGGDEQPAGEGAGTSPWTENVDVETLVDRAAEHDEDLAEDVGAVAEVTRDLAEEVERLEADLAEREEELDDLESRLKRKQADFQNYKKRRKREEERIRERATEDLVERLLDVRDNLVRALEDDHDDVEALREGVKMTLSEFDRVLDAENVREIDPDPGEEVDPGRHEVMMTIESDRPEGTVAEVYQPGYEMADQVLRSAKVTVSEGSDGSEE